MGARRALVVVALAAVLVAAACGDERGGRPIGAEAVSGMGAAAIDVDAMRGAGTPVADGVTVAEGSLLVSRVFPVSSFGNVTGWSALFAVVGDPIVIWNAYAEMLGVADADAVKSCVVIALARPADEPPDSPAPTTTADAVVPADGVAAPTTLVPDTTTSTPARPDATPRRRFLTERRIDDEDRMTCSLVEGRYSMTLAAGLQLACDADGCVRHSIAHLLLTQLDDGNGGTSSRGADDLRYERGTPFGEGGAPPTTAAIPEGDVQAPQFGLRGLRSALPAAGDPIDDGLDGYLSGEFTLPEGGRSLIAPAMLVPCNSGLVAVVRVPGDPAAALAWLDDASPNDDPVRQVSGERDGEPFVSGSISTAGGYYVDATAMPAAQGDGSDVFVSECGD